MMADHYLTKTRIDPGQCLPADGTPVLEAHAELTELLRSRAGEDSAQLFAEPLLSRGAETSAAWYSSAAGTAQPMARLDAIQQEALGAELRRRLEPLRPLLNDAEAGPLVAAALHIRGNDSIWSVDGTPVLVSWGMLPPGMAADPESRAAHYRQTLGRFLPLAAAPPLTAEDRTALADAEALQPPAPAQVAAAAGPAAAGMAAGLAASAVTSAPAGAEPAGAAAAGTASAPPAAPAVAPAPAPVPLWAWLPLLLLLLLSAAVLVWLLLPGSRIFPEQPRAAVTDEAALAASEEVNRALQARLAQLETALDGATCKADGTLLMPDGRTIEGLLPPDPSDRSDAPGAIRPASRTAILPPDPARVQVPGRSAAAPQDSKSLLAYIEERTAIVLAPSANGLSSGTGFFVGPDLLVTNFHVIAAPGVNAIYVTNKALGTIQQAQVLKSMGPFETTGGDFALLRVAGANQPAFTVLEADETLRLQSVIAAGYPGDLLQSDAQFQQLRTGDRTAVPELAVTDGTVSAQQTLNGRARVVVHSAPISQGNSGGPLIDMCGRLVGVNTFVKKGALRNLNFALSGADLSRFLANTDALPQVVTRVCEPQIRRPEAPRAAAADPQPDTAAPLPKLPALTPQGE